MEIIQEIGSYAGLAAIVGLAVLSALYFSQARDVRRLRDWAGRAPERTSEPAAQPPRVAARPMPRPPGAQPTQSGLRPPPPGTAASAAGAAPAVAPGPAAATPAAARAAANGDEEQDVTEGVSQNTMAHPPPGSVEGNGDDRGSEVEEESGAEESDLEYEEPARDLTDDSSGAAEDFEPAGDEEDEDEPGYEENEWDDDYEEGGEGGDRPSSQPPGGRPAVTPLRPASGAPVRPVPPPPRTSMLPPRAAPATRAGARPAAAARPDAARGPGSVILPPYERSRPGADPEPRGFFYSPGRAALVIGLGVLVLAAATLSGLKLAGGDDEPETPATSQPAGAEQGAGGGQGGRVNDGADGSQPAVAPAQVTVAVLNGTTVTGLAADVGDTVEKEGYQLGNVTNSLDQERAESVVFYAPGAEAEAKDVGRRLRITQREEIDPDTQALAGDASVVVVVGADKM